MRNPTGISARHFSLRVSQTLIAVQLIASFAFTSQRELKGQRLRHDEFASRLAELSRSHIPEGDGAALVAPPSNRSDTGRSWLELKKALDSMTAHLAKKNRVSSGKFDSVTRNAISTARAGLQKMTALEPDFPGALRDIGNAAALMEKAMDQSDASAPDVRFAKRTLRTFASSGAKLGAEGLERARLGRVTSNERLSAEDAWRRGLDFVSEGDFQAGFDHFGPAVFTGGAPIFEIELFEQNILDAFHGESVGYQFAIAAGGVLKATRSGGFARTAADPPATLQWVQKEVNIASTSKTITGTLVVQLLEDLAISVDASIASWLPPSWSQGSGIGNLSWRDLLTHTSGLTGNANGTYRLDDLRDAIEDGVQAADKVHQYQNINFSMFRVLIPNLLHTPEAVEGLADSWAGGDLDATTTILYILAVQDRIFEPSGFIEGDCRPDDPTETLLYPFPDAGDPGRRTGDWSRLCGSGGWYLSSHELLGFMAYRRFTNLIMSSTARNRMDNGFLGWNNPEEWGWADGAFGVYRSHGGDLNGGLDACIMDFPNGVQAAVLINSEGGDYSYQCQELADAFDNAYVTP